MVTFEIDPNVRIEHGWTFADLTHPVSIGETVRVVEPEAGIMGKAVVKRVDLAKWFVILDVDWHGLQVLA